MQEREILVDFDDTDAELVLEFSDSIKGVQYNAYCLNHDRSITGWTSNHSQIINAIYYHRRSNGGHSIRVYQRIA